MKQPYQVVTTRFNDNNEAISFESTLIAGLGKADYTFHSPFLEIMMNFVATLKSSSLLIVSGYSFSDNHVNMVMLDWLKAEENHKIHIYDKLIFKKGDHNLPHFLWINGYLRKEKRVIVYNKFFCNLKEEDVNNVIDD